MLVFDFKKVEDSKAVTERERLLMAAKHLVRVIEDIPSGVDEMTEQDKQVLGLMAVSLEDVHHDLDIVTFLDN